MSNITVKNEFSNNDIQLIKDTVCKGATNEEFKLFLYFGERTGLNPLLKQYHAVKRWNSKLGREEMTIQTGIDGFRVVAERSEKYAGQLGPFWCGTDGQWTDVWIKSEHPAACKVGVLRSDFKEPLWAVARFESYKQTNKDGKISQFWGKMPELMIAKVAEALALRKAFPQDLSGIYTDDEMAQADNTTPKDLTPSKSIEPEKEIVKKINEVDSKINTTAQELKTKATLLGINTHELVDIAAEFWGVKSTKEWKLEHFEAMLKLVNSVKTRDEFSKAYVQVLQDIKSK